MPNNSMGGAEVSAVVPVGAAAGWASAARTASQGDPNAMPATRIAASKPCAAFTTLPCLIVINLSVLNGVHYIHNRRTKRLQHISTIFYFFLRRRFARSETNAKQGPPRSFRDCPCLILLPLGRVCKPAQRHLSSPAASLLLDVPPVRLHKSSLHGTKIRQHLLSSEVAYTP